MSAKTDKNFIYDYLIHLDSYILHGVSEVGASPQKPLPIKIPKDKSEQPSQNKLSPVAFISHDKLSSEELQLFNKIVVAMGLDPEDIYLTKIQGSESNTENSNSISIVTAEITQISSKYIVCLGNTVANNFTESINDYSNSETSWQNKNLFQRNIILVTIPSIQEMLAEPKHKKAAWAHLKKVADQLQND
jgi:hypothetical protein